MAGEEKNALAHEALRPLAWSVSHHLCALAETEDSPAYIEKAKQILDLLLECSRDDYILSVREKLSTQ